jgi:protease I
MKKALIITWEKYQDHELIYPYFSLKEHGYEVDIMANAVGKIWGSLGTHMPCTVEASIFNNEENIDQFLDEYEILVVPGGVKALEKVRQEKGVLEFIRRWDSKKKTIFCICNGAQLLISAKILKGRILSGYYSIDVDIGRLDENCI